MKQTKTIKYTSLLLSSFLFLACSAPKAEKVKVVILGFDGANWATMDPLIAQGKLPFIQKLKEESAWAYFKTDKPTKSPVVWTSIATGKTMAKHGILDFFYLKKNKIPVPFSNSVKREPSLWQMLDSFGMRSVVINWFVTYPPDRFNGIMVSDRFRQVMHRQRDNVNDLSDSVYPQIEFFRLKKLIQRNHERVHKRIGIPDFPDLFRRNHPERDIDTSFTLKHSRTFVMQEALIENVSDELLCSKEADLYMSYFRLPDVTQHFVLNMLDEAFIKDVFGEKLGSRAPSADQQQELIARISQFMEPVYRYMDSLLQKYMSLPKFRDAYFFVMSDHGFSLYKGGYNHYDLPKDMEAPAGILMVKGPAVNRGRIDASIYDIAPSVLYLFGLPLDKSMDGKALQEIFALKRKIRYREYKLKQVNSAERRENADEEILDELRSLGYID